MLCVDDFVYSDVLLLLLWYGMVRFIRFSTAQFLALSFVAHLHFHLQFGILSSISVSVSVFASIRQYPIDFILYNKLKYADRRCCRRQKLNESNDSCIVLHQLFPVSFLIVFLCFMTSPVAALDVVVFERFAVTVQACPPPALFSSPLLLHFSEMYMRVFDVQNFCFVLCFQFCFDFFSRLFVFA